MLSVFFWLYFSLLECSALYFSFQSLDIPHVFSYVVTSWTPGTEKAFSIICRANFAVEFAVESLNIVFNYLCVFFIAHSHREVLFTKALTAQKLTDKTGYTGQPTGMNVNLICIW